MCVVFPGFGLAFAIYSARVSYLLIKVYRDVPGKGGIWRCLCSACVLFFPTTGLFSSGYWSLPSCGVGKGRSPAWGLWRRLVVLAAGYVGMRVPAVRADASWREETRIVPTLSRILSFAYRSCRKIGDGLEKDGIFHADGGTHAKSGTACLCDYFLAFKGSIMYQRQWRRKIVSRSL